MKILTLTRFISNTHNRISDDNRIHILNPKSIVSIFSEVLFSVSENRNVLVTELFFQDNKKIYVLETVDEVKEKLEKLLSYA